MSRKIVVGFARLLVITLCWSVPVSRAQEHAATEAKTEAASKIVNSYRLDFAVNEIEDGRKINTRQYSVNINSDDANTVKIGTRVPVESKEGQFQYIDVGTNIWSRLKEHPNGLLLEVRSEISNFALPDQATRTNSMPLLRQVQINASTLAVLGKPMVLGVVDDPNSKRQFQLEVTVTRQK